MRTRTWCSWRRLMVGAGLVWLLAPDAAHAQLFPNLAIKRKRDDCALEPPVFGVYRHQYYGYYATCWRRFPPGWGCPSPDAPNWQEELKRLPLQTGDNSPDGGLAPAPGGEAMPFPEGGDTEPGAGTGTVPVPNGGRDLPAVPEGRSPFELDLERPNTTTPNTDALPEPGGAQPTLPESTRSPFDIDRPQSGAAEPPAAPRGPSASLESDTDAPAVGRPAVLEYEPEERLAPPDFSAVPTQATAPVAETRAEAAPAARPQPEARAIPISAPNAAPRVRQAASPAPAQQPARRPSFLGKALFGHGLPR